MQKSTVDVWPNDDLAAFRRGDPAMLTRIYHQHVEAVARMLRDGFRFTSGDDHLRFAGFSNACDAQDVLQETFIRAFSPTARASYDGNLPFAPYVQTIAKNLVMDHLRAQGRLVHHTLSDEQAPPPPRDDRALHDLVQTLEQRLPLVEQRFVKVRYGEGLTQIETAKRLRVGRSRVRTLEQRVRRRLLQQLEQEGLIDKAEQRPLRALVAALTTFVWLLLLGGKL